jgi:hypothetical protein
MKKTALALLVLALFVPSNASALQTEDLVAVAAMPLAVAAVADITDVPASDLFNLIATMNRAQVPAPQFIEVVRYAPVALVDTREPFVPYITSYVDRGVTGQELAVVMEDRIETYDGADTIDVVHAPRVVAVDDRFFPEVVVTRFQPVRYDPLALVAMPLAVAAVADIADVPPLELASLVSLLNQASMPPRQFVEIVRYSPVALIDDDPQFITYVTTQVGDGSRGITLARLIQDRYEVLGVPDVDLIRPPALSLASGSTVWIPPVVTTRVVESRSHPHGGPPGQLKKELGLQTGAEVVHGGHPGRGAKVAGASARHERDTAGTVGNRGAAKDRADRVTGRGKATKAPKVVSPKQSKSKPSKQRVERAPRVKHEVAASPSRGGARVAKSTGAAGGGKASHGSGGGKTNPGKAKGKGKG